MICKRRYRNLADQHTVEISPQADDRNQGENEADPDAAAPEVDGQHGLWFSQPLQNAAQCAA